MITPNPVSVTASAKPAAVVAGTADAPSSSGELTREQRDALWNAAAKGMTPIQRKQQPEDPVRPWIRQILRKHKEGFSPAQIATMAAAPGITLKISARAVQRLITEHSKRKAPVVPTKV